MTAAVSLAPEARFPDDAEALPAGSVLDGADAVRAIEDAADYVVVGSGAAGATAALALAERGFSVALVEEGPWVRTRDFSQSLLPAMKTLFRGQGTGVAMGRAASILMQGRCVGGSTTINSAIAWRTPDAVLDAWRTQFGLGDAITSRTLEPHYEALEHELSVQPVADDALGEANALFGVASQKLGFESHRIRRYDAGCRGSAGCLTGCRHGRKLSMNVTFVPRALHAGARIYTNTRVDRVVTKRGRAVGIAATMRDRTGARVPLTLHARRGVFIAASTVQTPNVLRRSGVRAKALGRHFQAHPGVSIAGAFDRPVHMDFGATQGFNSLAFAGSDRLKLETLMLPPELAIARLPGFGPALAHRLADYDRLLTWAVANRAEAEGSVHQLFGDDHVRFTPTPLDMTRTRKGMRVLSEMMFAVGAREVYPGVHGMPSVLRSPDELSKWDDASIDPRAYNLLLSHLFGAARMGPDPRSSVVGTDFATHAVRGLYVVDSSVFPTNLGVNPQHTIMAVARLAVDRVTASPLAAG